MKHNEIEESLYDFLTDRLDEETRQELERHLETCRHCQVGLEELRGTISLLNEWKLPEISPDFEARVMKRIEGIVTEPKEVGVVAKLRSKLEIITDKIEIIINEFLLPFRLPLGVVVVVAVALLAVTIYYKGLTPEVTTIPKDGEITLTEVEHPIIIETRDIDHTLERLKGLIRARNGKLLQTIRLERGMKVTFGLEKEKEPSLFNELNQLGKVQMEKEGYKDGQGNIVVLVKDIH